MVFYLYLFLLCFPLLTFYSQNCSSFNASIEVDGKNKKVIDTYNLNYNVIFLREN